MWAHNLHPTAQDHQVAHQGHQGILHHLVHTPNNHTSNTLNNHMASIPSNHMDNLVTRSNRMDNIHNSHMASIHSNRINNKAVTHSNQDIIHSNHLRGIPNNDHRDTPSNSLINHKVTMVTPNINNSIIPSSPESQVNSEKFEFKNPPSLSNHWWPEFALWIRVALIILPT